MDLISQTAFRGWREKGVHNPPAAAQQPCRAVPCRAMPLVGSVFGLLGHPMDRKWVGCSVTGRLKCFSNGLTGGVRNSLEKHEPFGTEVCLCLF